MKNPAILILFFLINLNSLYSQKIETRFKGGQESFTRFVASNITYPENSRNNSVIGSSISAITINKQGKLKEIMIINSLGNELDNAVIKVIVETKSFWLPDENDNDITFILPVKFSFTSIIIKQDKFTCDNLLDEIEVTAFGPNTLEKDKKILKKYQKALEENKDNEAIGFLSELIRRNPYNMDYYKNRAILYQKVGKNSDACLDLKKIKDFLKKNEPADIKIDCN